MVLNVRIIQGQGERQSRHGIIHAIMSDDWNSAIPRDADFIPSRYNIERAKKLSQEHSSAMLGSNSTKVSGLTLEKTSVHAGKGGHR
jgi:hypothetical protein